MTKQHCQVGAAPLSCMHTCRSRNAASHQARFPRMATQEMLLHNTWRLAAHYPIEAVCAGSFCSCCHTCTMLANAALSSWLTLFSAGAAHATHASAHRERECASHSSYICIQALSDLCSIQPIVLDCSAPAVKLSRSGSSTKPADAAQHILLSATPAASTRSPHHECERAGHGANHASRHWRVHKHRPGGTSHLARASRKHGIGADALRELRGVGRQYG
jgi:hypothetical protein